MSWREHDESEESRVGRDEGTRAERAVGWVLTYPVRTLVIAFVVVVLLTISCGL